MLHDLLHKELDYRARDSERSLDAVENARLVRDAEACYRGMYFGAAEPSNLRDRHMFETLEHLLDFKGAGAKAVVWPHNSHISDTAFTEMGLVREEINIGQFLTESKPLHERLLAPAPAICPRSRRIIARGVA
jgi:erythromycin esterase-like protein